MKTMTTAERPATFSSLLGKRAETSTPLDVWRSHFSNSSLQKQYIAMQSLFTMLKKFIASIADLLQVYYIKHLKA